MKSHSQTQPHSGGGAGRGTLIGAMPYMSARQTEAYLKARDAIRRIQRTSSIVDSISKNAVRGAHVADRNFNSH